MPRLTLREAHAHGLREITLFATVSCPGCGMIVGDGHLEGCPVERRRRRKPRVTPGYVTFADLEAEPQGVRRCWSCGRMVERWTRHEVACPCGAGVQPPTWEI